MYFAPVKSFSAAVIVVSVLSACASTPRYTASSTGSSGATMQRQFIALQQQVENLTQQLQAAAEKAERAQITAEQALVTAEAAQEMAAAGDDQIEEKISRSVFK